MTSEAVLITTIVCETLVIIVQTIWSRKIIRKAKDGTDGSDA